MLLRISLGEKVGVKVGELIGHRPSFMGSVSVIADVNDTAVSEFDLGFQLPAICSVANRRGILYSMTPPTLVEVIDVPRGFLSAYPS